MILLFGWYRFGGVNAPVSAGKSHVNLYLRQLLSDYYAKAWEKPREPVVMAVAKKRRVLTLKPKPVVEEVTARQQEISRLVSQAEEALANRSNQFVVELVSSALQFNTLILDFNEFAKQRQRREDDDLLLLSLIL